MKTVKVDDLQNTLINNGLVELLHQTENEDIKEEILSLIKKFETYQPDDNKGE